MALAVFTVLLKWPDTTQPLRYLTGFDVVGDIEHSKVFRRGSASSGGARELYGRSSQPTTSLMSSLPPGHLRIRSSSGSSPWRRRTRTGVQARLPGQRLSIWHGGLETGAKVRYHPAAAMRKTQTLR